RKQFIEDFKRLRNKPLKLKDDVFKFDPLSIFLMERESNRVFNRTLLSNGDILELIKHYHTSDSSIMELNALRETGHKAVPLYFGDVPILANIKIAEGMLNK